MSTPAEVLAASQLATSLREHADLMRYRATHLGSAGAELRWHSAASGLFRRGLEDVIGGLLRTAALFETSADAIARLAMAS